MVGSRRLVRRRIFFHRLLGVRLLALPDHGVTGFLRRPVKATPDTSRFPRQPSDPAASACSSARGRASASGSVAGSLFLRN